MTDCTTGGQPWVDGSASGPGEAIVGKTHEAVTGTKIAGPADGKMGDSTMEFGGSVRSAV